MADEAAPPPTERLVEHIAEFTDEDLHALCEATSAAIIDGGGFGWVNPPGLLALETYFRGVLLVPERELFIAPYARGHGLARMLTIGVEERARELGYHILNLDVRETQQAAIQLYESLGFERWGVHPDYAFVRGQVVRGFFYSKRLRRPGARRTQNGA